MTNIILTQDELKIQLNYDENTGLFKRLKSKQGARIGVVSGTSNGSGYLEIRVNCKKYKVHRLVWLYVYGDFPNSEIDHADGDRSNNRIQNLRLCSRSENMRNIGIQKRNKSGFKGVSWYKPKKMWQAQACINNKKKSLGLFKTAEAASDAYQAYVKKHHGNFYKAPNVLS